LKKESYDHLYKVNIIGPGIHGSGILVITYHSKAYYL